MQLNAVVLPAPLGPISPTISYSFTSSVRSDSACRPPNRIDRSLTSSTDTGALHRGRAGLGRRMELEAMARHPARDGLELRTDPASVEQQRLQEEQGADQTGQPFLPRPVVAVQHRYVNEDVVHPTQAEELVQQLAQQAEERARDDDTQP